jgi:hypothetical protein
MKKLISSLCILCAFVFTGLAQDVDPVCPKTITVQHVAGDISPVTVKIVYKTMRIDDICWIVQNLGAERQATTWDDSSEEARGWYWQFGHRQGYQLTNTGHVPSQWTTHTYYAHDWALADDPCTQLIGSGWHVFGAKSGDSDLPGYDTRTKAFNSEYKLHATGYLHKNDASLQESATIYTWLRYTGERVSTSLAGYQFYKIDGDGGYQSRTMLKMTRDACGFPIRCCKYL